MKRRVKHWLKTSLSIMMALVMVSGILTSLPELKADALIVMSAWPGSAMTPVKGYPGIYSFEVPPQYNMIIFSDGKTHYLDEFENPMTPAYQTKDLSKYTGALFQPELSLVEGNSIGMKVCGGGWTPFSAPGATPNTVYCKPPKQWGTPSCYAWDYFNTMPEKPPLDDSPKPYHPAKYPDDPEPSFTLDSGIHIEIPDDWIIGAGNQIDLNMDFVPVEVFVEGDTVRIGLGATFAKEFEDLKKRRDPAKANKESKFEYQDFRRFSENFDNYKNNWDDGKKTLRDIASHSKALDVGFPAKIEVFAEGYAEGHLDNQRKLDYVSGGIGLSVTGSVEAEKQWLIGYVPLVGKFSASASLSGNSNLSYGMANHNLLVINNISATLPEITGSVGIGVTKVMDASVYGSASHTFTKAGNLYNGSFNGEIGISTKLFCFENKLPLMNGSYIYYRKARPEIFELNPQQINEHEEDNLVAPDIDKIAEDLNDPSKYKMNRPDEQRDSQFNGDDPYHYDPDSSNRYRNLQNNVNNNSAPKTVPLKNGKQMMVMNADRSNRSTGNHIAVVYTIYDPDTDKWTEPKVVDDDGTADGEAEVATDGENVYIVYPDVSKELDEDATLLDVLENTEIELAKFDPETDTFEYATLTDDGNMDSAPAISVTEDGTAVTWVSGDSESLFNENGKDMTVKHVAVDKNLNAGAVTDIAQTNGITGSSVSGSVSGRDVVAYTDNAVDSADYGDVFVCEPGTAAKKIFDAEGEATTYNLKYSTVFSENLFTFINGTTLYGYGADGLKALNDEACPIIGDYAFISSGNKTYLVSVENADDHNEAYLYHYRDGKWTDPVAVTDNNKSNAYIRDIGGFIDDSGELSLTYMLTNAQITEDDVVETSSLITQQARLGDDVELLGVDYDPNEYVQGARMPVKLMVKNNGTEDVNKIKTVVLDDENKVVTAADVSVKIPSGKTVETQLNMPTRNVDYPVSYKVFVCASGSEPDTTADSFKNVALGYTDLSMIGMPVVNENQTDKGYCFFVRNNSKISTEALLIATPQDDIGNKLAEYDLGTVKPGEEKKLFMNSSEVNKIRAKNGKVKFTVVSRSGEHENADNIVDIDFSSFDKMTADTDIVKEFKNGDTDGDGSVDMPDATFLQRHCTGMRVDIPEETMLNSDVNDDGDLDVIDVTWIQRYLANMKTPFKVGENIVIGLL